MLGVPPGRHVDSRAAPRGMLQTRLKRLGVKKLFEVRAAGEKGGRNCEEIAPNLWAVFFIGASFAIGGSTGWLLSSWI